MFDPAGPVLGIDPGLSRCGYGAVHHARGRSGPCRTGNSAPIPATSCRDASRRSAADLAALITELRPSALAVERVLFQANVRTAISVGQASGLALATAASAGIPVAHYSPNEVKLAVTGSGAADKRQVQAMVTRLLALDDGASARRRGRARLALCHSWSVRIPAASADATPVGTGLDHAIAAAVARERCFVIGSVRGTVIERSATGEVLVEVAGVGYRLLVPLSALPALSPGDAAFLFTHLHARDDALELFGFPTRDERDTFEILWGRPVSGPSSRSRSCRCTRRSGCAACLHGRRRRCAHPRPEGRQAHRAAPDDRAAGATRRHRDRPDGDRRGDDGSSVRAEVREALTGLGYGPDEVREALTQMPDDGPVEERLRDALRLLATSGA